MRFDYKPPIPTNSNILFSKKLYLVILGVSAAFGIILLTSPNDKNKLPIPTKDTIEVKLPLKDKRMIRSPVGVKKVKEIVWDRYTVRSGDTLSSIFTQIGIPTSKTYKVIKQGAGGRRLNHLRPGQVVRYTHENGVVNTLIVNLSYTELVEVKFLPDGNCKVSLQKSSVEKKLAFRESNIQGSLYQSAQQAGLDDRLIMQMVDIFGGCIDFALDIRPNDTFKVLYEEKMKDGKKIGTGNILAIEFINKSKVHRAVRFTNDKGTTGYFSPNGEGMQRAFLRTPVKFTRISSKFTLGRKHPILHRIRKHTGVDYAAPHGTPIKSVSNGRVNFIGKKGGYGKVIELKHGRKYSTLYAHLSRFAKKLKKGSSVKQGQVIGYVGATGLATGPHLHYEFRVNGVHRDPLTVKLPRANPIDNRDKDAFTAHAHKMIATLESYEKQ